MRTSLLFLLGAVTSCANPAFEAYKATVILGASRQIIRYDYEHGLRFDYRGGTVIYRPYSGSRWLTAGRPSQGPAFTDGVSANLPNGCLVYACVRAEQIRLQPRSGESHSQVIGYRRADGGGHAFVVFLKGNVVRGEDNLGFQGELPRFRNRSSAEALRVARAFHAASGRSGIVQQAWFLGSY